MVPGWYHNEMPPKARDLIRESTSAGSVDRGSRCCHRDYRHAKGVNINAPLPPATAGKRYSGKFNLRVGEELHEKLAIESMKVSESLNSYCVKVLKDEVGK